jgi:hypothetical protein
MINIIDLLVAFVRKMLSRHIYKEIEIKVLPPPQETTELGVSV